MLNREINTVLAIDPGNTFSGICLIDRSSFRAVDHGKFENRFTLDRISSYSASNNISADCSIAVIEMISHYGSGMPAGADVFDTCVWIGRFTQALLYEGIPVYTLKRQAVKLNICGTSKARDSNITQALVDRFAKGQGNYGKGTKKDPGFFYGFAKDVWQAYALGVSAIDLGLRKLEEQE